MAPIANGHLADPERAVQMLDEGANLIAIGRGALANPSSPCKVRNVQGLTTFGASVLSPIADTKAFQLTLA